ncbi:hypothetical protein Scep_022882 [Stephania cephalantha]|uniref:Uncharacterized protein n=1 Tax=Stephania cephalantha TaxID=152367 RepID=A0AAP0FBM7_9MAGN
MDMLGSIQPIAIVGALTAARRLRIGSHACSSASSAAPSAFVFLLEHMATSRHALVTITGRPRRVAPSALEALSVIQYYF